MSFGTVTNWWQVSGTKQTETVHITLLLVELHNIAYFGDPKYCQLQRSFNILFLFVFPLRQRDSKWLVRHLCKLCIINTTVCIMKYSGIAKKLHPNYWYCGKAFFNSLLHNLEVCNIPEEELFKKKMGKGENGDNQHFLLFPQWILPFKREIYMSDIICRLKTFKNYGSVQDFIIR